MEEKEYNDIESLAAYLNSDKMQALKAETEKAEGKVNTEKKKPSPAPFEKKASSADNSAVKTDVKKKTGKKVDDVFPTKKTDSRKRDIDDVLFSIDSKRKRNTEKPLQIEEAAPKKASVSAEKPKETAAKPVEAAKKTAKEQIKQEPPKKQETVSAVTAVPPIAGSLSELIGEAPSVPERPAADMLPPEDRAEVYGEDDEGEELSEAGADFDKAATRMMNAVAAPTGAPAAKKQKKSEEKEGMTRAERHQLVAMRRSYERQKQRTRTFAYILVGAFLSVVIVGAAAFSSSYLVNWALDFTGIAATEFKIDVDIPDKASISEVAAILSENNIIRDAKFFKFYADISDKYLDKDKTDKEVIGGKYTLTSTMSYSTLLKTIRTEALTRKTISIRIVEGMNAREIGELLEENNVCYAEDFEKYYRSVQNNYDFERRVKESPLKLYQLEGYLFPDTYEFYVINAMENGVKPMKGETMEEAEENLRKASEENAEEAAKKMYSNFNEKMTRSMYKTMGEMHMTLDEVVALASMVQKEAASVEDMGYVASVFLNRIRASEEYPYLQSDVTALYVENEIRPHIKASAETTAKVSNAYNTYVCVGIPAGAICNPGLDAINAVLYAPDTPYYYFCANKTTGDVYYASTHAEHEQNLILAELTPTESPDSEEALDIE